MVTEPAPPALTGTLVLATPLTAARDAVSSDEPSRVRDAEDRVFDLSDRLATETRILRGPRRPHRRPDPGRAGAQRSCDDTAFIPLSLELGVQALDRRDAHLLFMVLRTRSEHSSTIITSNTSIRDWPELIAGDEMLATVFLDRLLHHCHVVQIDGRSFRLRDMQGRQTQP